MALPPQLAAVILNHVDPGSGRRRLALLRDIAAHASSDDPGGWIRYGYRELRAAKRTESQAGNDRKLLKRLVEVDRILEVVGTGRRGGFSYRFRDLDSDRNWLHLTWSSPKAELGRRWVLPGIACLSRESPGQRPALSRESPGQILRPETREPLTSTYARAYRVNCGRGAGGIASKSWSDIHRSTRYRGDSGRPPTVPLGLLRNPSSSSTAPAAAERPQDDEGARAPKAEAAAVTRVERAIIERCRQANGAGGWVGGQVRVALVELVATYPTDELVAAVGRIADAGVRAVPELVRQLGHQAAAGFPCPAAPAAARHYDLTRPDCPDCGGSGMRELDDGTVTRCDHAPEAAEATG